MLLLVLCLNSILHFKMRRITRLVLVKLPIYLGTSRAVELGEPHLEAHISQMPNLFYTDELLLRDMNYEAAAYVDYLVGLNSVEVLGHSLSSFSQALNREKGTRNFYDNDG